MPSRILIIQGHPDPAGGHLCHALAEAYAEGARAGGHPVARLEIAALEFPLLRTKLDYDTGVPPPDIQRAQEAILAADHLVVLFPLWAGEMPALLKGFFEQTMRPTFAFADSDSRPRKRLAGRSARVIITMGMPAFVYRFYFRAHGLKNLRRNILGLTGIGPIHASLIGQVEGMSAARLMAALERIRRIGRRAG